MRRYACDVFFTRLGFLSLLASLRLVSVSFTYLSYKQASKQTNEDAREGAKENKMNRRDDTQTTIVATHRRQCKNYCLWKRNRLLTIECTNMLRFALYFAWVLRNCSQTHATATFSTYCESTIQSNAQICYVWHCILHGLSEMAPKPTPQQHFQHIANGPAQVPLFFFQVSNLYKI